MTAADLLRIIARGVEIGHTGRLRTVSRDEAVTMARDYCDRHGLSYARCDLQIAERAAFLLVSGRALARIDAENRSGA